MTDELIALTLRADMHMPAVHMGTIKARPAELAHENRGVLPARRLSLLCGRVLSNARSEAVSADLRNDSIVCKGCVLAVPQEHLGFLPTRYQRPGMRKWLAGATPLPADRMGGTKRKKVRHVG